MGMEEEIVQNYLLKSARLITTAPRFKADLLRAAEQKRGSEFVLSVDLESVSSPASSRVIKWKSIRAI
jgi:hypothetical protein